MAIGVRATATFALTTNTTGGTATIPASIVSGDILYLLTANRDAATDPTVVDDDIFGNTWARAGGANNTGSGDLWWKRATPNTAGKTITVSGCTGSCSGSLIGYSGCLATGTPYEALSAQANASGVESHTAITTLGPGRVVMLAVVNLNNDNAVTAEDATDPNTITHQVEHLNTGGNDCATCIASAAQGTQGSTGTFTWAQTNGITVSIALALIPQPTIALLEPGTSATGDLTFFSFSGGAASSDTVVPGDGTRSLKLTTGSPAVLASVVPLYSPTDAGNRISFRFLDTRLPDATATIFRYRNAANAIVFALQRNADGTFRGNPTGATIVDGTTVVPANAITRLTVAHTVTSAAVFRFDVYINGVLELSCTAGTLTNTTMTHALLSASSAAGADYTAHFWDEYADVGTDYTDPGAGVPNDLACRLLAAAPNANNVNNFDTNIGNNPANRWENVNEVPLSTANGWEQAATADTQENYGVKSATVLRIDQAQVLGRLAWIFAKAAAGGVGTPKIMDNGTESAVVLTNAGKLFTVTTTANNYPTNAAGIGMRATNNADDTFLYECGQIVAFHGVGQPTMRRWGGIPGMTPGPATPGRSW